MPQTPPFFSTPDSDIWPGRTLAARTILSFFNASRRLYIHSTVLIASRLLWRGLLLLLLLGLLLLLLLGFSGLAR